MAYTLSRTSPGTITLEDGTTTNIKNETFRKISNLIPLSIPLSDSDETEVFDFGGAVLEITVEGTANGAIATVRTFLNNMLAFINGAQSDAPNSTYHSDLMGVAPVGNYIVKVESFDFTFEAGLGTTNVKVDWSLKLVQSLGGV